MTRVPLFASVATDLNTHNQPVSLKNHFSENPVGDMMSADERTTNGGKYCVLCKHIGHLAVDAERLEKANYQKNGKEQKASRSDRTSRGRSERLFMVWRNR
ncbi:hypothetical protein HPB48_013614 [Haemaphysalis longicornis]|uniref:Uncharacterized protein n=1 Tax=Haemaphysalis longicornis TaxID=44386 RepID=A0A9J6FWS5_HAELO|nr:hypothetical protein HPB48_013614 [Haemaphysalis longicornis]